MVCFHFYRDFLKSQLSPLASVQLCSPNRAVFQSAGLAGLLCGMDPSRCPPWLGGPGVGCGTELGRAVWGQLDLGEVVHFGPACLSTLSLLNAPRNPVGGLPPSQTTSPIFLLQHLCANCLCGSSEPGVSPCFPHIYIWPHTSSLIPANGMFGTGPSTACP